MFYIVLSLFQYPRGLILFFIEALIEIEYQDGISAQRRTSRHVLLSHASFTRFTPPKRIAALTTPISAPPAMKTGCQQRTFLTAFCVEGLPLCCGRLRTSLRRRHHQRNVQFNGMNIPSAKARAGILQAFSNDSQHPPHRCRTATTGRPHRSSTVR